MATKKKERRKSEAEEEKEDEISKKRLRKGSNTKEIIEYGMHKYGNREDSLLENSPMNMDNFLLGRNPTI